MITSNIEAVSKSLDAKIKEIERNLKSMTIGFAESLIRKAINNTKLGDSSKYRSLYQYRQNKYGLQPIQGFARGSWKYSEANDSFIQENYGNESGNVAASKFVSAANQQYRLGDTFLISNTGYYIQKIQNRQNPQGILQPSLQDMLNVQHVVLKDQYDRG